MKASDIASRNDEVLRALAANPGHVDPATAAFFGYYTVDLFDCPPFVMFTNDDCPRATEILFHRRFEPGSMQLWCRLARNASGIVDIGAHVGVYSLAAAALRPDLKIHAFEPNPFAYTRLRVHRRVNGFDQIVEHPVAVASWDGQAHFGWQKKASQAIASGGGLGERRGEPDVERIVVPTVRLDNTEVPAILGGSGLMKIDVEGGEHEVFSGMPQTLAQRPDIILETFNAKHCRAINAIVQPLGYRAFLIHERTGELEPLTEVSARAFDGEDYNQLLTTRAPEEVRALRGAL